MTKKLPEQKHQRSLCSRIEKYGVPDVMPRSMAVHLFNAKIEVDARKGGKIFKQNRTSIILTFSIRTRRGKWA